MRDFRVNSFLRGYTSFSFTSDSDRDRFSADLGYRIKYIYVMFTKQFTAMIERDLGIKLLSRMILNLLGMTHHYSGF